MASKRNRNQAGKGRTSSLMTFVWMAASVAFLVMIAAATMFLLLLGMLPTITALILDRSKQKYAVFCVGGMNAAGLSPYILDLWFGAHSIAAVVDIMTDALSVAIIYGAAAFGWVIYTIVPPVVVSILTIVTQRRVASLRTAQRRIIEEWGEDVTLTIDKDARRVTEKAGGEP